LFVRLGHWLVDAPLCAGQSGPGCGHLQTRADDFSGHAAGRCASGSIEHGQRQRFRDGCHIHSAGYCFARNANSRACRRRVFYFPYPAYSPATRTADADRADRADTSTADDKRAYGKRVCDRHAYDKCVCDKHTYDKRVCDKHTYADSACVTSRHTYSIGDNRTLTASGTITGPLTPVVVIEPPAILL